MFEKALIEKGYKVMLSDLDATIEQQQSALKADLVILSLPIEETPKIAAQIAPQLTANQIFSDFTSVKTQVVPAMLSTQAEVISCHPLFGPMESMAGQNLVLLPVRQSFGLHALQSLFGQLELKVNVIEPWQRHDAMMSLLQGLIHFVHIVFAHTLRVNEVDLHELVNIASPVYKAQFAFACRILNRDPSLYAHILMDNPANSTILKIFVEEAKKIEQMLEGKNIDAFVEDFQQTRDFLGDLAKEFSTESEYMVEKMADRERSKL